LFRSVPSQELIDNIIKAVEQHGDPKDGTIANKIIAKLKTFYPEAAQRAPQKKKEESIKK
jgi:hypothetical protein